ncbi:hypothetical protein [Stappia indica]|uniref:hypothetical protein n=1 Tax=Stappia indica TaxID=538381 RepID=UPI001CD7DE92|nr:hypothetical protein [Stappia indica]MCA1298005.1 hypothetical protein [Stappia indica]
MKIVAMVRFNKKWAYVFDAPVCFQYSEETINGVRYLIGRDGPFVRALQYEKAQGRFKAFAGAEITLSMADGSSRTVKDDWWSVVPPFSGVTAITYNTVDELKRCYVYMGGCVETGALESLVSEYETRTSGPYGHPAGGWRYGYYDFEKVIKFDDIRRNALRKQFHLERANKHLVRHAKSWAAAARSKPRFRVKAISVKHAAGWLFDMADSEVRRGVPCPACNSAKEDV